MFASERGSRQLRTAIRGRIRMKRRMDVGLGCAEDTSGRARAWPSCVFMVPPEEFWERNTTPVSEVWAMRRGFTLPEVLIVLTIAGVVMAIAVPSAKAGLDRVRVRSAASDV